MSQAPRRINTQRSLNRPTEQRPTEAPASRPAPLQGQPDFFDLWENFLKTIWIFA